MSGLSRPKVGECWTWIGIVSKLVLALQTCDGMKSLLYISSDSPLPLFLSRPALCSHVSLFFFFLTFFLFFLLSLLPRVVFITGVSACEITLTGRNDMSGDARRALHHAPSPIHFQGHRHLPTLLHSTTVQ